MDKSTYKIRQYEWNGGNSLLVAVPIQWLRDQFPSGNGVVELLANPKTGRLEIAAQRGVVK